MKKLSTMFVSSLILLAVSGCSSSVTSPQINLEQAVNAQSTQTKADIYPFEVNKDFFPLYNATQWKYDVYDKSNKLVTTMTKVLDVSNEKSLEVDKPNNFYLVALKQSFSNSEIKITEPYEYIRRRNNQLAYGKVDDITYYPDKQKSNPNKAYNPYEFRAFSDFSSSKLETIKVKAGTFQCIKSEFTLKLDKYTIWYAKGVGEVKRLKEGYFNGYRYELSEYNNTVKQFVLNREAMTVKDLPADIQTKSNAVKDQFLKLNSLPADVFSVKTSASIFVENKVVKDNYKKNYEISYINKSLSNKDNITLIVNISTDGTIKDVYVSDDNNGKPTYQGKVVDKLPLINK